MKIKKRVLVTIFVFVFLLLSGIYLVKSKDITYKNINSNSKKYEISYGDSIQFKECNRYFEGKGTEIYGYNEVNEGYPMYVLEGCAVDLGYFLEKTDLDESACQTQKNYAEVYKGSSTIVSEYNYYCKNYTGSLEVSYAGFTCDSAKEKIINSYIDYVGLHAWYNNNCIAESGEIKLSDINKNGYNLQEGNCERKRIFNNTAISFEKLGFTGILKNNEGGNTCPYPLFYVNGYATTWEDYQDKHGNDVENAYEYCDKMYDELKDSSDAVAINDYRVLCNLNNIKEEIIAVPIQTRACNHSGKITSGNYDISNFVYDETNLTGCTSEHNKLPVTGIYDSPDDNIDYPLYLVQGCAWGFEDIITNKYNNSCITDAYKQEVCFDAKARVDLSNMEDIKNFNNACIDSGILDESHRLQKTEYISVYFQTFNAAGLECVKPENVPTNAKYVAEWGGDNNKCVYRFDKALVGQSITLSKSELPDTSKLIQNVTGLSFSGWKNNNDLSCNDSSITFTLPNDVSELVYEACFNGEIKTDLGYKIYNNCDGTATIGSSLLTETNINDRTEKDDIEGKSSLENQINAISTYVTSSLKTKSVSNGVSSFNLNQFCTIGCKEKFIYTYPSVFATVKSGTYFELLDYPSIQTALICDEHFNFTNWETVYKDSIKEEKKAYVNYLNRKTIDELSFYWDGTCCMPLAGCDFDYYNSNATYYNYNETTGEINSTSMSFGYCEPRGRYSAIYNAQDKFKVFDSKSEYEGRYETAYKRRQTIEEDNIDCAKAMSSTEVPKDKFYNIDGSKAYFIYESDAVLDNDYTVDGKKYYRENLIASNTNSKDTDLINYDGSKLEFNTVNYSISYDSAPNVLGVSNTSFDAKQPILPELTNSFMRKVEVRYTFSPNHGEYYADYHTGNINNSGNGIHLGYVYPLKLNFSGTRNVYFEIDVKSNLNYGASQILTTEKIDDNRFKCTYDIVNDIVVEDTTTTKEDYKKNFYIRSISTQDVDPNDRFESGTLGSNWSDTKGQALIDLIEKKNQGSNTYNPDYLEYSFTLNAQTIEAIREYNKINTYSDFKFECNNMGGECKSIFLNNLAGTGENNISHVDGVTVNNINAVMNRNTWKYYIDGRWVLTKSIESNQWKDAKDLTAVSLSNASICYNSVNINNCEEDCEKLIYDCLYRKVNKGVLP